MLDQNIDTSTPHGKLLFNMFASIAELETEIRKEYQLEGIEKAKAKSALIKDLMNEYKISKTSV